MIKKKLLIFFILISLCASIGIFSSANNVNAQGNLKEKLLDTQGQNLQNVGGRVYEGGIGDDPSQGVAQIVALIINSVLGLLGVIFLVLIIYAGFLWMTATGNDEQVTKAKNILIRAIIGVIIIVAAYAISFFVLSAVTSIGRSS